MKNLVRRQVVPRSEYEEEFGGKTAAEWAEYYGLQSMAEELRYYVSTEHCFTADLVSNPNTPQF